MDIKKIGNILEQIYTLYHKPKYIKPDPLQFLYDYQKKEELEIVGLIAASFAIGRVDKIIEVVDYILRSFDNLYEEICETELETFKKKYKGFKYRFYDGDCLSYFLYSIGKVIKEFGSIEKCLKKGYNTSNNFLEAQSFLVENLEKNGVKNCGNLVANPKKGSACKRLNLYLRWMIRDDNIDLGVWNFDKSKLIMPIDTHIFQLSKILGLSSRNSANLKTAEEITNNLKKIDASDPTRFDFSLSRLGIHPELDYEILSKLE